MFSSNNQGFTLMELLVVMGIMGVITTLAIPNYKEAKNAAYDAALKVSFRQAIDALTVGQGEIELNDPDYAGFSFWTVTDAQEGPTEVTDPEGAGRLMPGYVVPNNVRLRVYLSNLCAASGACGASSVHINLRLKHCKSGTMMKYYSIGRDIAYTITTKKNHTPTGLASQIGCEFPAEEALL